MPDKSLLIIGAGIAGLSAGIYARLNGYDTTIFELHDLPGGLCTAWDRKEYTFDGCLHYLFGTGEGQAFNPMWQELGALEGVQVYNHDELMHVVGPNGERLIVYADPDRLQAHMSDLSPRDASLVEDLCAGVRQFMDFDLSILQQKPKTLMTPQDWAQLGLTMTPYLAPLMKWGLLSAKDFGGKFKDPFLQRAVPLMFAWPDAPVMVGMQLLASLHSGNAGFPAGGSLQFARNLERRYLELGGKLLYKSQVDKILVEDNRAAGVRLYSDEVHRGERVLSAADLHSTLFEMLDEKYLPRKMARQFNGELPIHTMLQISLGVNRDLRGEPHWTHYLLPEPVLIGGQQQEYLSVKHYSFDPSMAPAGKSSMVIMLPAPYGYWQRIYGRRLYDTEQIQVERQVIALLEGIYPGITGQVEVADVATPLSYERYTNNWQGSSCGWLLTTETMMMMIQGVQKRVPWIENFHLAGQWVEPGGSVPVVAASGKNAVWVICHEDGQEFQTRLPDKQSV